MSRLDAALGDGVDGEIGFAGLGQILVIAGFVRQVEAAGLTNFLVVVFAAGDRAGDIVANAVIIVGVLTPIDRAARAEPWVAAMSLVQLLPLALDAFCQGRIVSPPGQ